MSFDPRVFDEAMAEIGRKSRKALYTRDFDAWSFDVLGRRYYERLRRVNAEIIEGKKSRFAIKSANGCGKSMWLADWETYWVTVFPAEESLALATANGRDQIRAVIFKYLKDNYGYMKTQARENKTAPPVGWINEQLEWKYDKPDGSGHEALVIGKRPADQDIVSSFQGTRKRRTLVGLDEAGGLPVDIYTASEAVLTGEESLLLGIGNPDRRATEFHSIFIDPLKLAEWSTHTISAYDLPTITGEIVYPNDPEKQDAMLRGLTSAKWIYHKERAWKTGGEIFFDEEAYRKSTVKGKEEAWFYRNTTGKKSARFLAKVDGEFPGETDNSFFSEDDIELAYDTDIDPAGQRIIVGADVAAMGEDESVVYINRGGHVRLFDKTIQYDDGGEMRETTGVWDKEDEVTGARRIHAIAMHVGADEVRIDAAGLGGGIYKMLERLDEFADKCYELHKVIGSNSSTDRDQWNKARSEHHDTLRALMHDGKIDLDRADTQLREELLLITYELDNRRAVAITPKKEMKTSIGGSPDRADAAIYSVIDTSILQGPQDGDVLEHDMAEIEEEFAPFYEWGNW